MQGQRKLASQGINDKSMLNLKWKKQLLKITKIKERN